MCLLVPGARLVCAGWLCVPCTSPQLSRGVSAGPPCCVPGASSSSVPFAVVPCCVFWKSVPGLDGAGVRSCDDLLAYLQALRPPGEIQRTELGFDGRNTVLWWRGPSSSPALEPGYI